MSFLDLFKKKKKIMAFELPPPPLPPKAPSFEEEIPSIRPSRELPEISEEQQLSLPIEETDTKTDELPQLPVSNLRERDLMQTLTETVERVAPKQLFVSVDDYKKVMQGTNIIRAKLIETETAVKRLSALSAEEDQIIEKWSKELTDVERKLARVDHIIAKVQL